MKAPDRQQLLRSCGFINKQGRVNGPRLARCDYSYVEAEASYLGDGW